MMLGPPDIIRQPIRELAFYPAQWPEEASLQNSLTKLVVQVRVSWV